MVRHTRSTMRQEHDGEGMHANGTVENKPAPSTFNNMPSRSCSRAPDFVDMDLPTSEDTIQDEDLEMNGDEHGQNGEAAQSFGDHSRKHIKAIQKLDALGVAAELSLPEFIVVGDQSHGKSSIIEATCGISLPRSSGTCTRCPFRITTTAAQPGEAWSCTVTLSRRYVCGRDGKTWTNTSNTDPVYFATVTDRADLDRVLQLAQTAILNPTLDPAALLTNGAPPPPTARSLLFSYNPIELRISGEELPELSMLDLPGSINVAPDEDKQHLVKLIEKLIGAYVKNEKALILLVASMDQDLETSTAFRLVLACKALPRSMGVLTKADLFTNSTKQIERVRQTLSGEKFKLGNSWFVTKNSSQDELDNRITHLEARERETEFFRCGVPWSTELVAHSDRFGTKKLQDAISHRLVEHIESELPDIIERVNARLSQVVGQLDLMPERPNDPCRTVIEELLKLIESVKEFLQGDKNPKFRYAFKGLIRGFRKQLQSTRPEVILSTPGYVKPVVSIDSDDENMSNAPTPSKRQKINNGRAAASPVAKSTPARAPSQEKTSQEKTPPGRVSFTLDKIHEALDQARNSDMPDQIHPKVIDDFILRSIQSWPQLTADLLEGVQKLIDRMLRSCVSTALSLRRETALMDKVLAAVTAIHAEIQGEEHTFIHHLVDCEMHQPITYTGVKSGEVKTQLRESRNAERIDEYYDTQEAEKRAKVPMGAKRKELAQDLNHVAKTLGPDRFATEVTAMASPLAYYDVAAARLTDTLANHLEFGVLHALQRKLHTGLMLELRVSDRDYCAELLAQDPAREVERLRLVAEQEKLVLAIEELRGLPGQH